MLILGRKPLIAIAGIILSVAGFYLALNEGLLYFFSLSALNEGLLYFFSLSGNFFLKDPGCKKGRNSNNF